MELKYWILIIITNVTSILIASDNSIPQVVQFDSAPADKISIIPSPLRPSVLPETHIPPNNEEERLIRKGRELCKFYEQAFDPKGKRFLEYEYTELRLKEFRRMHRHAKTYPLVKDMLYQKIKEDISYSINFEDGFHYSGNHYYRNILKLLDENQRDQLYEEILEMRNEDDDDWAKDQIGEVIRGLQSGMPWEG